MPRIEENPAVAQLGKDARLRMSSAINPSRSHPIDIYIISVEVMDFPKCLYFMHVRLERQLFRFLEEPLHLNHTHNPIPVRHFAIVLT